MIFPLHIDKMFGKTPLSAIDKSVVFSVLQLTPVFSSISLNPEDFTPESVQKKVHRFLLGKDENNHSAWDDWNPLANV